MPSPTPTKSNLGQIIVYTGSQIRSVYSETMGNELMGPTVNSYDPSKEYEGIRYEARQLTTASGFTFEMPAFNFVGYSKSAMALIDKAYAALVQAIQSGSLDNTGYLTMLANVGSMQEEIYSLSGGTAQKLKLAKSRAGGVSYGDLNPNPDGELESVIFDANYDLSHPYGIAQLIGAVFHEPLHHLFRHDYVNETGGIEANLTPITVDTIQQDFAYKNERLLLETIGTSVHKDLTPSFLEDYYETGNSEIIKPVFAEAAKLYEAQRINWINEQLKSGFDADPQSFNLSPSALRELEKQKFLRLKRPPRGLSDAELDAYKDDASNYEWRNKTAQILLQPDGKIAFVVVTASESGVFETALTELRTFFGEYASEIGASLGSNLGRVLFDGQTEGAVGSVLLGTIGANIGETIELARGSASVSEAADDAFADFLPDLRDAALGALSSYLVAELVDALDLEGTLGDFAHSVAGAAIDNIAVNLANGQVWSSGVNLQLLAGAAGSFVGTLLARRVVDFDTIGGQIGAAVGASVGTIVGVGAFTAEGATIGAKLGSWAGPIGAAVGAFAGYILGGLIGSIFGGTPRSSAELGWSGRQFVVTNVTSKSGGSKEAARNLAESAAAVLNGVIAATGSTLVDAAEVRTGSYGTRKKNYVYRATHGAGAGEITFSTRDAQKLINHGAAIGVADLLPRLVGGNVYVKRAVAATLAQSGGAPEQNYEGAAGQFDVTTLLGNIAFAQDYATYIENEPMIALIIAAEPESPFATGWTVTMARALELGLHKRWSSDWTGGWSAYLDQQLDGRLDGVAFTPSNVLLEMAQAAGERRFTFIDSEENVLAQIGDTIDTSAKNSVVGTANSDIITIVHDTITDTAGLTIDGALSSGGELQIDVAAVIDGGAGDDLILGGDLGNDVLGSAGNDTLVGGALDDWLFGGDGNDRLFAGGANWQFTDGDTAATRNALEVDGGNGNLLDGGEGDDALYGSRGSDWLRGGAGTDLIYGGAGGDIIDGGSGNDSGPSGEARLFGGGGTDQYVFGYGSGVDVAFDDEDEGATPGSSGDSFYDRMQQIQSGVLLRNWAGGGDYEVDGSVRGGEDAISFGAGIGMDDLILQRSGNDLVIRLTVEVDENTRTETGDQLTIKDWFESTRRVEWLRFADGEEVRIADIQSFIVGSAASDVIVGTNEADFIYGGAGNDVMWGLAGDDFGFGAAGNDLVAGDDDNDWVAGGLNDDKVIGGAGNDTVFGDSGNDEVYGGAGSDIVAGGRGDDVVVGGSGNDIFRFHRGDGRDVLLDDYVNNWDVVWQNGSYVNGYSLDPSTGVVSKNGEVVFDGSQWIGQYDFDYPTLTFRRHLGAVGGTIAANAGTDYLEFGVGIDMQDLMFRRSGNDLEIAVTQGDGDAADFDDVADRITIRDWYLTGNSIENFVFLATGRHEVTGWNLNGGTAGADTLNGGSGVDWLTGNHGDDALIGNGGDDILSGNAGADLLRGGGGADVLYGGDNDDTLEGGAGADVLIGGSGFDIASYANAAFPSDGMRVFLDAPQTNTHEAAGDTLIGIEGIEGSSGMDLLGGDANGNLLRGLAGNDYLLGGAGDDTYEVHIGDGQDAIGDTPFVTEEILDANGSLNTDLFTATWINTSSGGDEASGYYWTYQLIVTHNVTGEDVYRSGEYDFVYSSPASGPPPGFAWPITGWLSGAGLASDPMPTGNGAQVVRHVGEMADGGHDTLELGPNISLSDLTFERLNGNADLRVRYSASDFVTISGQAIPTFAVESLQLNDGLTADLTRLVLAGESASSAGDFLAGDGNANTLDGLGGDDVLSGAGGDDVLRGGDGNDVLEGGAGADTLDGGNDSVSAGLSPDAGDPTGEYGDTIRYAGSNAAVTVDLAARTASGGHASGDVIAEAGGVSSIENVVGSQAYGDTLRGDARANRLAGLGGDDVLEGRQGDDVLVGGLGNDQLYGGDGEDNLAGEDGDDLLEGGAGDDLLAGGAGNDTLRGDAGADVLSGGDGVDTLFGGSDDDQLGGDAGNDVLYGEAGNDRIAGGDGDDSLYGGDGDDELIGGAGNDQLFGGAGNDSYYVDALSGADVIVDADGSNRVSVGGVTSGQLWITRSGDDLRIGTIGGTTIVTLQGYYSAATPTRVREVALEGESLYLAYAEPLIAAMTAASSSPPAATPPEIATLLPYYWHAGGDAAPTVQDQAVATDEDTPVSGTVAAIDHDENIASYAVDLEPYYGTVALDTATGAWTYTPDANFWGEDSFQILVTDADGNTAVQTVTVNVASVNDAPTDVLLADAPSGIEERDHPPQGTTLGAIVLGTLSAVDPDAPDPGDFDSHVFSVADSRFEIVSGNVLRLRANAALDYEASATVSVDVTVTDRDGAGLSHTRTFTFDVLDRDDYFYGTAGNDTITGQAGRNLIYGQGGNDVLSGANANDELHGGDGADELYGNGGHDLLRGDLGNDLLDGGAGDDTLWGGDGADTLHGLAGNDVLSGEAGLDTLLGGAGNDELDGGADNDRLEGGDGDDRLVGGTGDDVLVGGLGADRFLGGAGVDTVTYAGATAGIAINLATGTGTGGEAAGDVFEDTPERVEGSAYADTITGSSAADTLEGGAGNDTIYGGAGNDVLIGGAGDDYLDAQAGDDLLDGGAGNDILVGGTDNDTYLITVDSGVDEIRNFDPNGADIDVVGYQDITNRQLWFERSGNDLVVTVVGTSVRTTIKDWYLVTTASDRANYKIDFFLGGQHVTETVDAEALVNLMAGYTRPTTQTAYDALHADPAFEGAWAQAWGLNAAPIVPEVVTQTINEDGTLTLGIRITDDYTPPGGISVVAQAVRPDNYDVVDTSIVNPPTIGAADADGDRTLTVTTKPNASGQVAIKLRATDAGGLYTERVFLLNVTPVADTPALPVVTVATPQSPLSKPTLDSGSWTINIQGALVDQDGSEVLDVRISNVPSGISFNTGTNLGGGVWSFGAGPWPTAIIGPAGWSQDLALTVTAIARETANGQTASTSTPLNIVINARPTDLWADRTLAFNENTPAGTGLAWFGRNDADAGDTAVYELLNSAGGRFTLRSDGLLSTGSTPLDYEAATSHTITVRVTDSGGLSRTEDFTIAVNNVNEAPTSIWADRTLGFYENVGTWAAIAWFGGSDPDNNITSYSLVNDAGGRFWLRSDGLLSTGGTPLDYEAASGHWITVRATDAGGLYRDQSFWVDVYNVNEAPWIDASSFSIYEGAHGGPGSYLLTTSGAYARVTGGDPEGATLSYQLVGGDTSVISIDSAGYLHIQGVMDYETRPTYSVLARAWDGGAVGYGNYVDKWITIYTQNVNEAPTVGFSGNVGSPPWNVQWHAGTVTGWDPEGTAVTYEIVSAYRYWQYTSMYYGNFASWEPFDHRFSMDANGNLYVTYRNGGGLWEPGDFYWDLKFHFNVRVRDASGLTSGIIGITINGGTSTVGPEWHPPVVLDLDGDGIELVPLAASSVSFRSHEKDAPTRTGWIGADDGVLALDRNGDGAITHFGEISFMDDLPGATTDLEGLAAYDTDGDGSFDADDAQYSEFMVWRDANQDGVSQSHELASLAEHGIVAISLSRTPTGETTIGAFDNVITATSQFTRNDGSTGVVGDVVLAAEHAAMMTTRPWPDPRLGGDAAQAHTAGDPSQEIDDIDRNARDGTGVTAPAFEWPDEMNAPAAPAPDGAASPEARRSRQSDAAPAESRDAASERARSRRRPWRWSDLQDGSLAGDDESLALLDEMADARQSALHASLDTVVRRRLQMIEAMASFAPEGASHLELHPQRKVDPRTLELLTSVPEIRVA